MSLPLQYTVGSTGNSGSYMTFKVEDIILFSQLSLRVTIYVK